MVDIEHLAFFAGPISRLSPLRCTLINFIFLSKVFFWFYYMCVK